MISARFVIGLTSIGNTLALCRDEFVRKQHVLHHEKMAKSYNHSDPSPDSK